MNAIEIALKMETDAVEFYSKSAEKTSHTVGKRMFLSIMEDEKRHIEYLNSILKGMDITIKDVDPMKEVKSVFEELKNEMQGRIKATSDDIDALDIAMDMEKKGYEFYVKAEAEAADKKSKALFARLKVEEDKHYMIFSNTATFLKDNGNWFMWEERGIVEG